MKVITGTRRSLQLARTALSDEKGLCTFPWLKFFQSLTEIPTLYATTHGARAAIAAADYPNGSMFYETDRTVLYVAMAGVWTYVAGMYSASQLEVPDDLGAADAGFEMCVADYGHRLRWDGQAWGWAPGDTGSGMIAQFLAAAPPIGWQACDGSAEVTSLLPDGTLELVTVPNTPGSWYRQ